MSDGSGSAESSPSPSSPPRSPVEAVIVLGLATAMIVVALIKPDVSGTALLVALGALAVPEKDPVTVVRRLLAARK